MKKILLISIIFVLNSCITRYKTSTLFEDDGYKYEISYPISKHNEWSLFYGATDSTIYKLEDGSILKTMAILNEQGIFGGAIEIYILDKDSFSYKSLLKSSRSGFKVFFENIDNTKKNTNVEDIYNWIDNKNNKMLSVVYEIGNNKVILFVISENSKDTKKR